MEKAPNAGRLKTPLFADPGGFDTNNQEQLSNPFVEPPATHERGDTTPKGPTETLLEDQEVLPNARQIPYNVQTQEGDAANISLDYTLSEEREGDNISGNKELRKDGADEDENNSKKAKGPLQTETT